MSSRAKRRISGASMCMHTLALPEIFHFVQQHVFASLCSALNDNADSARLSHLMHEVTPKVVAIAVSTVITMWRIFPQMLLFSIVFLILSDTNKFL